MRVAIHKGVLGRGCLARLELLLVERLAFLWQLRLPCAEGLVSHTGLVLLLTGNLGAEERLQLVLDVRLFLKELGFKVRAFYLASYFMNGVLLRRTQSGGSVLRNVEELAEPEKGLHFLVLVEQGLLVECSVRVVGVGVCTEQNLLHGLVHLAEGGNEVGETRLFELVLLRNYPLESVLQLVKFLNERLFGQILVVNHSGAINHLVHVRLQQLLQLQLIRGLRSVRLQVCFPAQVARSSSAHAFGLVEGVALRRLDTLHLVGLSSWLLRTHHGAELLGSRASQLRL